MNEPGNSTVGRLWCLNDAKLVLKDPKCSKNISPTLLHQQPESVLQGRLDSCFHAVYASFWTYHPNVAAEIKKLRPGDVFLTSNLSDSVWSFPVSFPSAVQRCSSADLKYSGRSHLTFDINKALITRYFVCFWMILYKLETVVWDNPSRSTVSEMLRLFRLAPTTMLVYINVLSCCHVIG